LSDSFFDSSVPSAHTTLKVMLISHFSWFGKRVIVPFTFFALSPTTTVSSFVASDIVRILFDELLGVFCVSLKPVHATKIKANPKASAPPTYTGTSAKWIKGIIPNFSSRNQPFSCPKNRINHNTGENIAYTHMYIPLTKSAIVRAIMISPYTITNNISNAKVLVRCIRLLTTPHVSVIVNFDMSPICITPNVYTDIIPNIPLEFTESTKLFILSVLPSHFLISFGEKKCSISAVTSIVKFWQAIGLSSFNSSACFSGNISNGRERTPYVKREERVMINCTKNHESGTINTHTIKRGNLSLSW